MEGILGGGDMLDIVLGQDTGRDAQELREGTRQQHRIQDERIEGPMRRHGLDEAVIRRMLTDTPKSVFSA